MYLPRPDPHFNFNDPNEPIHDVALMIDGTKVYASKPVFFSEMLGGLTHINY